MKYDIILKICHVLLIAIKYFSVSMISVLFLMNLLVLNILSNCLMLIFLKKIVRVVISKISLKLKLLACFVLYFFILLSAVGTSFHSAPLYFRSCVVLASKFFILFFKSLLFPIYFSKEFSFYSIFTNFSKKKLNSLFNLCCVRKSI